MAQGSFNLRWELCAKKRFLSPQWGFGGAILYTKPSQKHQKLTSFG
jgi:hypothetical protein